MKTFWMIVSAIHACLGHAEESHALGCFVLYPQHKTDTRKTEAANCISKLITGSDRDYAVLSTEGDFCHGYKQRSRLHYDDVTATLYHQAGSTVVLKLEQCDKLLDSACLIPEDSAQDSDFHLPIGPDNPQSSLEFDECGSQPCCSGALDVSKFELQRCRGLLLQEICVEDRGSLEYWKIILLSVENQATTTRKTEPLSPDVLATSSPIRTPTPLRNPSEEVPVTTVPILSEVLKPTISSSRPPFFSVQSLSPTPSTPFSFIHTSFSPILNPYETIRLSFHSAVVISKPTLSLATVTTPSSLPTAFPSTFAPSPFPMTFSPSQLTISPSLLTFSPYPLTRSPSPVTLSPSSTFSPSSLTLSPSPLKFSPSPLTLSPSPLAHSPSSLTLSLSRVTLSPSSLTLSPPLTHSPSPLTLSLSRVTLSPSPLTLSPSPETLSPSPLTISLSSLTLSLSPSPHSPSTFPSTSGVLSNQRSVTPERAASDNWSSSLTIGVVAIVLLCSLAVGLILSDVPKIVRDMHYWDQKYPETSGKSTSNGIRVKHLNSQSQLV